jgi:hypothetical protein
MGTQSKDRKTFGRKVKRKKDIEEEKNEHKDKDIRT